jgi:hypothetical protein
MKPGMLVQHRFDRARGVGVILKILYESKSENLYRIWWGPKYVGTARGYDLDLVCK